MAYSVLVQEIAYAINPKAFKSYSGYDRLYKAMADKERSAALEDAQRIVNRNTEHAVAFFAVPSIVFEQSKKSGQSDFEIQQHITAGLRNAQDGVAKRAKWIQNRKDQQEELADLAQELVNAKHLPRGLKRDNLVREINIDIANKAR